MRAEALTFAQPPLGLGSLTDFALDPIDGADAVYALRGGDVRLFVLDAAVHLPTYSPELSADRLAVIGATTIEKVDVFVVVNPAQEETTVNLIAPIIVHRDTGVSAQVILDGQNWPLRQKLAA
ncbi:flagellar assembly protein FliW [Leifsonia sp. Leaf264]|uniref:flagellar assembly protein FliW n=1 Tax=Leifsonia sp. Leaf264 TaxID=1736314 RepID=UPI0006F6FC5A|nr:flagellar assembly protein FliW [Leifsonia sp. Leaf264]KQO98253.1 hypothetical protein ASF30_09335 [Leifsonia sp. Leaf264]